MLGVAFEFKNKPDLTTPENATNLNNMQKLLVDLIHPVGTYYETSDSQFDPNTAWGGTWILETDGTVLVSKSNASGSRFNDDIGTVVGEETHTLTEEELAEHDHTYPSGATGSIQNSVFGPIENSDFNMYEQSTYSAGGNQPHNNIQPSKIVNRWHRTA